MKREPGSPDEIRTCSLARPGSPAPARKDGSAGDFAALFRRYTFPARFAAFLPAFFAALSSECNCMRVFLSFLHST